MATKNANLPQEVQQTLSIIPELSGSYQYYDKDGEIIYVGKAKNLKKRVYSYFNKHHDSPKLRVMVPQIAKIQFIVTDSEVEALILESHLIKKHKPKYNVLLKDDKTLPEENAKAISYALSKGVKFVLCSGRSNMSLDVLNEQLGLVKENNYTVAFNGSTIYENVSKKKLINHLLKGEYGSEVLDILRQYPVNVLAYENEKLWCDKPTDRIKRYAKNSFIPYYVTEDLRELVSQDFSKIIAISDNEKLSQIQQACNSCGLTEKVGVFFSGEDILEFNPYNIDKGTGVKDLLEKINIDPSEAIAIGDNFNDIPMIENVGMGVAVKNGVDEIKSVANYVTENDNNHNAVAEVIQKFI